MKVIPEETSANNHNLHLLNHVSINEWVKYCKDSGGCSGMTKHIMLSNNHSIVFNTLNNGECFILQVVCIMDAKGIFVNPSVFPIQLAHADGPYIIIK